MIETKGVDPNVRGGPYAIAAGQARYMIERSDWTGAAALQVQPSRFAYVDAVTHFARALGAARSGHLDGAAADIAKIAELREKLRQGKDAYWSEQVDIQWQIASAWLLQAQSKHDEALAMMRDAADAEDKTEKSVVTPGPLAPARELYGTMLLQRGMGRMRLRSSTRFCTRSRTGSMPSPARRSPPCEWATRRKPRTIQKSSSRWRAAVTLLDPPWSPRGGCSRFGRLVLFTLLSHAILYCGMPQALRRKPVRRGNIPVRASLELDPSTARPRRP